MNFLVDNQLPAALARFLSAAGHPAQHVLDVTLNEADDRPIWDYAKTHSLIVISKDEDFVHLVQRPGEAGRLLWVRIGNCRNESLLTAFESALAKIEQSFAAGQRLVELR